ncbi:MAG: recombinase family protein [Alphaproteobacteria bacterium]|nr:recombinase family protein [Alphaproteobacteria bacterium]
MKKKYSQVIEIEECKQAVMLARVSSRKQERGASLNAQVERIEEYCKKNNFAIIEPTPKAFVFTESSTRGGRKKFKEMIEFIEKQKHKTAICVHTLDRLQRGFEECAKIKQLLKDDKIEVHFIQEALVLDKFSSDDDFTRYDFGILSAKLYLTSMNKNVKRSQKFNREAGMWQGLAKIGYLNAKDERRKSTLILDPDRAPIIKQIFEEYATGVHSLKSIWLSAIEKGLMSKEPNYNPRSKNFGKICPISRNKIHDILTDPFYYGYTFVACEELDERTQKPIRTYYKLIKHIYEPIISKELFDRVQNVLHERKKEKFCKEQKYAGIPFTFRGLITCKCGCGITPEHHKKGNKEYVYLRCSHQKGYCNQKLVNENIILKQLEQEIFSKIRISPTMHDLLKTTIIQSLENEKKININARKKIDADIAIIDNRLERLWECYLDRDINKARYETEKQKYLEQKQDLQAKAEKFSDISNELKGNIEKAMDFVVNLPELMKIATPDEKNTLLKKLLTNCVLDGKVLKYEIKAPFDKLISCTNYKKWKDVAMENLEEFEKIKV